MSSNHTLWQVVCKCGAVLGISRRGEPIVLTHGVEQIQTLPAIHNCGRQEVTFNYPRWRIPEEEPRTEIHRTDKATVVLCQHCKARTTYPAVLADGVIALNKCPECGTPFFKETYQ